MRGGCSYCGPLHPKHRGAEPGPAARLLHEARVSAAATAGPERLPPRPLPSAAAAAPGGGGGACRTVSIGPQVLVGAGAGAWAAEGAGLRAAVSRTERGLLSDRGTSRRRSPKPQASCSRRRCASPGRPRRQGPSASSRPAPSGLPGPGRPQVRSRCRGPGPPGPALPHGPPLVSRAGALCPSFPRSPKAVPAEPGCYGVGAGPEQGLEGGCWNPLCAPAGARGGVEEGPSARSPSSAVRGGSKNCLPIPISARGDLR